MGKYAEKTKVPAAQSRSDIEKVLENYGAHSFAYGITKTKAAIGFDVESPDGDRSIRFTLPLPKRESFKVNKNFQYYDSRYNRSEASTEKEWKQAIRQRWRALFIVIKAKLEGIESGIETFDSAFLAYIVLPDNKTAGQSMLPMIAHAYESGTMPNLYGSFGLLPAPDEEIIDAVVEDE